MLQQRRHRVSDFLLQQLQLLQQAKQQRAQEELYLCAERIRLVIQKIIQALPKVQTLETKKQ